MRKVLFLFGQLNDDDVEWMLKAGAKRFVPAGGVLIEQGVPVDSVFILLEGRLAVWLKGKRGPERELARLSAGEIVGEMSFVDARPPSATVKALEDSAVFAIPKPALNAKLAADAGFAARFYRALAIYLSTTVRERHRALGGSGKGETLEEDDEDDADELDPNVLDGVYLAGERFDRMVKRVLVS
ncbi:MAG TPA: cyclic nucleotide-binding domain-containing protein [Thermoanaerobaculia bacterium]|jgi:CRP-like cAMP-binding protein|nr:cyclic nucleotide-binding domain-containing protein [Thermoanaerobaculia bacterium]